MKLLTVATLAALSFSAFAADPPACPEGVTSCTISDQDMGDTTSSADNSQSQATQSNPSSNSNASGVNIDPVFDNKSQVTQNATNTTTGTISGGNTNSDADASAIGNKLDSRNDIANDNKSSVGNTSSNSGGNVLGTNGTNTSDIDNKQGQGNPHEPRALRVCGSY